MSTIKTFAFVRNASGEPEILCRNLDISQADYEEGNHYEKIEEAATEEGYEFIGAFDQHDPAAGAFSNAADLAGALQACRDQIEQMNGMFDDSDGTIQDALDAAEESLNGYYAIHGIQAP